MSKLTGTIKEAIRLCGLKDGMTVSFHHHLRNGDYVLNMVMQNIADMGFKDIKISSSSIHDVHGPVAEHIKTGVVTGIDTNYIAAPVGKYISEGYLDAPVTFRTHGGRPAAIESGEAKIDIAFIAAPSSDVMGNINGVDGPSACGSLGYAFSDARCAKHVVAITDNIVDYPLFPVSIDETQIDYVVKVDSIGDPSGIVSGTTRITRDPIGLTIASSAADVIVNSGLLKDGFSFQTGAGGASLAVTKYLKSAMNKLNICGSFALGGITGYMVDLMEEGYFKEILDVQCFDLRAVKSLRDNPNHIEISASRYANPLAASCAVDNLDVVVLGATEIDLDFNVNVHTDSNGYIMGGSGGHSDTAAGSKLTIIVAPLFRARLPIVVDKVLCITTPGKTVDVLVTQRGIAVNPLRKELKERLSDAGLPIIDIEELKYLAEKVTGVPERAKFEDRVVANVVYRDGTIIDQIKKVV